MLRLRLHRIWAVCTKQYRKTLKTLGISRVKRKICDNRQWKSIRYVQGRRLHFAGVGFFRCRNTDANVLNGFFNRLEIYPKMKTERFTAVKRSVFV